MKIDKSELKYGTRPKVEDKAYLHSYRDRTCVASRNGIDLCGNPAVGAHVRVGETAGMGTKPGDNLTIPLCWQCHADQEAEPGYRWWVENVLKPMARRQYREWKQQ